MSPIFWVTNIDIDIGKGDIEPQILAAATNVAMATAVLWRCATSLHNKTD